MFTEMYTVVVGPQHSRYHAYRFVLEKIPYFYKLLEEVSDEAKVGIFHLPSHDPDAFARVLHYLLADGKTKPHIPNTDTGAIDDDTIVLIDMIQLHLIADHLSLEKLANHCIDQISQGYEHYGISDETLLLVEQHARSDGVDEKSRLYKLLIHWLACDIWGCGWEHYMESNPELLSKWFMGNPTKVIELATVVVDWAARGGSLARSIEEDCCHWHCHQRTSKCKRRAGVQNASGAKKAKNSKDRVIRDY